MSSSWHIEAGQLVRRWSDAEQRVEYKPSWMQEATNIQGSYLLPPRNFTSYSVFGGASWFQPNSADREFDAVSKSLK